MGRFGLVQTVVEVKEFDWEGERLERPGWSRGVVLGVGVGKERGAVEQRYWMLGTATNHEMNIQGLEPVKKLLAVPNRTDNVVVLTTIICLDHVARRN